MHAARGKPVLCMFFHYSGGHEQGGRWGRSLSLASWWREAGREECIRRREAPAGTLRRKLGTHFNKWRWSKQNKRTCCSRRYFSWSFCIFCSLSFGAVTVALLSTQKALKTLGVSFSLRGFSVTWDLSWPWSDSTLAVSLYTFLNRAFFSRYVKSSSKINGLFWYFFTEKTQNLLSS